MKIKVLGPVHEKTKMMIDTVAEVMFEHGLAHAIEHISDAATLVELGLYGDPILLIDEVQVVFGINPSKEEIKAEIKKFIQKEKEKFKQMEPFQIKQSVKKKEIRKISHTKQKAQKKKVSK